MLELQLSLHYIYFEHLSTIIAQSAFQFNFQPFKRAEINTIFQITQNLLFYIYYSITLYISLFLSTLQNLYLFILLSPR